ncbi:glycosyltransferase family 9 protein [Pseudoalteromonas piscicida]|uniref:glycosyltransferase family 9 protein n=1 Tax=Pseudoalteromonas piscicida TaxID=43662 RepID=UPI001C9509BE|nr:glycosyltransferase family 9 protein [Pseudoalteromonas piscicida]QZO12910.1 glycosyltransferase family 9 protein [Pseudoalteromonas piscicida]
MQYNNILIVRLSAIGDIVMASGLISALKARYPEAKLSWLAEPAGATLLQQNPLLDEVILWPRNEWQKVRKAQGIIALLKRVSSFKKQLASRQFDLVLDAQGLLKSGVLAWLSGAQYKVGINSREGSQWLMNKVVTSPWSADISSEYRAAAKFFGAPEAAFQYSLIASNETQQHTEALLLEHTQGQPYVVFCPFTTRAQKHWADGHWRELYKQVNQSICAHIIILGGPSDIAHSERLAKQMPGIINLTGKTTLLECSEIIRGAKGVIGVDTGLTHMAMAHHTPVIALFGSTLPYENTFNPNGRVLSDKLACSPCKRRPTCEARFDCMVGLTPQRVSSALGEVL